MSEGEKKDSGKPYVQYVPQYAFPQSGDTQDLNRSAGSSALVTPVSDSFNIDDSSEPQTSSSYERGSPYKKTYGILNDMLPPPSNSSVSSPKKTGSTGSYRSGRRQRPRSLYADLDSFINNTAPSLVMKSSTESLGKSLNNNDFMEKKPTLVSLVNSPTTNSFALSPPKPVIKSMYQNSNGSSSKLGHSPSVESGTSLSEFLHHSRSGSPVRNSSPSRRRDSGSSNNNPFNFNSISMSNNNNILQKPAHRRGHRYKHSSVSMNLFLEPKKRAQLNIPTSLPIPSVYEFFQSCSHQQKFKIAWVIFHIVYSCIIFIAGFQYSITCLTTLSHLVFFDSIYNLLVVIVDIFKNFEAWEKSSIRYPFGLSRLEVLFAFALSISLFYVGFDLITHSLEEFVISLVDQDFSHENHHTHHNNDEHKELPNIVFVLLVLVGIFITLISNQILYSDMDSNNMLSEENNDGTGKLSYKKSNLDLLSTDTENNAKSKSSKMFFMSWHKSLISGIKKVTRDNSAIVRTPIKLLTIFYQFYLFLFYPALTKLSSDLKLNEIQTFMMATLILYFAFQMIKRLSMIILLSFPYNTKVYNRTIQQIKDEIIQLDTFKSHYNVKKILISKANYKLFIVLIKLKMTGESDNEELRIRNDMSQVIKRVIRGNLRNEMAEFDITIDIDRM